MKTSGNQPNKQNKQGMANIPKPEIRDNLDSRQNEEQHIKGDDITSNKKATKNVKQKKKENKKD